MLDRAKANGLLSRVIPHLFTGGLTHLQYADDTIIFIPCNDKEILVTKFLLYCFEIMSGLKINYDKSEVFAIGLEISEVDRVAKMLNCPIGSFPIKY